MAGLNETPKGDRAHMAFFGLRNAGKSTLVNAFTGQDLAIVSARPGTTTDPVSKAMEILPLGPCLVTDTAGLDDDEGELGAARVAKTLAVLEKADVAVWVSAGESPADEAAWTKFEKTCAEKGTVALRHRRGESVETLKARMAAVRLADAQPPLVGDLVKPGDRVVCVCPIDGAAPKGRLILPQQQVVRELLDAGAVAVVCQVAQLAAQLDPPPAFVVTDSQAFAQVAAVVPPAIPLTSFSIVFARAKGDLAAYCAGAVALRKLRDGDRVLIVEGCTHRRQCGDIGTEKLPHAIEKFTGRRLEFAFAAGDDFPLSSERPPALVVHCGGCMLARRVVQARIARCRAAGVPISNYGIVLAACHGIVVEPSSRMVVRDAQP